jgi:hypothetical protein
LWRERHTPSTKAPTVRLRDDFETGELFAWEEYPYAQDIGYDPRLVCQKEPSHNGSAYAIARIVMPNDALDLSAGLTKQIDLWTTGDTRVKFFMFLTADRKPEYVEVSLGLFADACSRTARRARCQPLGDSRSARGRIQPERRFRSEQASTCSHRGQAFYPLVTIWRAIPFHGRFLDQRRAYETLRCG